MVYGSMSKSILNSNHLLGLFKLCQQQEFDNHVLDGIVMGVLLLSNWDIKSTRDIVLEGLKEILKRIVCFVVDEGSLCVQLNTKAMEHFLSFSGQKESGNVQILEKGKELLIDDSHLTQISRSIRVDGDADINPQGRAIRSTGDYFHVAQNIEHSQEYVGRDLAEWLCWLRSLIV
ncbi:hypothetical protein L2E82_08445 [Cichorium intybus]|uniref:Uncharacterized protein n=1 Tax=Cichorium intybus TaxID=13427 RepID=A0ACB9G6E1_CICIN|nr:hypothetical protein L2E82_08445 [Cichorium intybus]